MHRPKILTILRHVSCANIQSNLAELLLRLRVEKGVNVYQYTGCTRTNKYLCTRSEDGGTCMRRLDQTRQRSPDPDFYFKVDRLGAYLRLS